jgi:hypothetical protein
MHKESFLLEIGNTVSQYLLLMALSAEEQVSRREAKDFSHFCIDSSIVPPEITSSWNLFALPESPMFGTMRT